MVKRKYLAYSIIFLVSVFIAYKIAPLIFGKSQSVGSDKFLNTDKLENENNYIPKYRIAPRELVFIYIGCATCPAANTTFLPELIEKLKISLRKKADSLGYGLRTVGIAKDFNVRKGIDHLNKYGDFDEISVGSDWANLNIQEYVWEKNNSAAVIPQVILAQRSYNGLGTGNPFQKYIFREEVVLRKAGPLELIWWLNEGISVTELIRN